MRLSEFIIAAILVELTPGPNMAYLASLAATRGRRAGLAGVAGVAAGLSVYGVAAAAGLAALIANAPIAYEALRWAGFFYLLWLAFEAWRESDDSGPLHGEDSMGQLARRGFIVNVLNPKAGIFYVAVLPAFIAPSLDAKSVFLQNLTLVGIFVVIATIIHGAIALAAAAALPWLTSKYGGDESKRKYLRRALAIMLAMVALWLLYETAR